jgi:hypothetical protein
MKYVSQMIDMQMIDQQYVNTALKTRVSGSSYKRSGIKPDRSPGSDQYPHAGRIFEQQRPVTNAELARGGAERGDHYLGVG